MNSPVHRRAARFPLAAIMTVLAIPFAPAMAAVTASKELPEGAQFTVDGGTLRIAFWSDDVVRVTYANGAEVPALKSLAVVATPSAVSLSRQENAQAFTLAASHVKVKVDKKTGAVSILDASDHPLVSETTDGRKMEPSTQATIKGDSCMQSFDLPADEGIYGLGQHQDGVWNYRAGGTGGNGVTVRLAQANTNVGVPVITSSKGYMLLWDNPAVTTISAGAPVTAAPPASRTGHHDQRGPRQPWGRSVTAHALPGLPAR